MSVMAGNRNLAFFEINMFHSRMGKAQRGGSDGMVPLAPQRHCSTRVLTPRPWSRTILFLIRVITFKYLKISYNFFYQRKMTEVISAG
jgi:hypothetical protein